jgi:hypothetical protein
MAKGDSMNFPIFKTIILGSFKTANEYRTMLTNAGIEIGDDADDILENMEPVTEKVELDLADVMVSELGLSYRNSVSRQQIYDRAQELGLCLCPAETGPALRLALQLGEWYGCYLYIAMESIVGGRSESLGIFYIKDSGPLRQLDANYDYVVEQYCGNDRFIFVRPRR